MKPLLRSACRLGSTACRWHRRLAPSLAALALALPGGAHPCSLEQLLQLPFERLLQLEISPRRLSSADAHGANLAARSGVDGQRHAV